MNKNTGKLVVILIFVLAALGCTAASTSPVEYTVTFEANGGTVTPESKKVEEGMTITQLPLPVKTDDPSFFVAWYVNNGMNSGNWGAPFTTSTPVTADITIYARWEFSEVDKCTITFNADGGTVTPSSRQVPQGSVAGDLPVPVKDENLFGGWYTAPAGGGTEFTAESIVNEDITVYAKWTANAVKGNGTENNPYRIYSRADFDYYFPDSGAGAGTKNKYYRLEADLTGENTITSSHNIFYGVFDGNGHTINLNIEDSTPQTSAALFYTIGDLFQEKQPEVKNLMLSGSVTATRTGQAGALGLSNFGIIRNVGSSVTVTSPGVSASTFAGGIVTSNEGIIADCYSTGDVSATGLSNAGGITATNSKNIIRCWSTGSITADGPEPVKNSAGGIVGTHYKGVISNCVALNSSVLGGSGTGFPDNGGTGRIAGGRVIGGSLSNNYARSDMSISIVFSFGTETWTSTESNDAANTGKYLRHGSSVAASENTPGKDWWTTASNWDETYGSWKDLLDAKQTSAPVSNLTTGGVWYWNGARPLLWFAQ